MCCYQRVLLVLGSSYLSAEHKCISRRLKVLVWVGNRVPTQLEHCSDPQYRNWGSLCCFVQFDFTSLGFESTRGILSVPYFKEILLITFRSAAQFPAVYCCWRRKFQTDVFINGCRKLDWYCKYSIETGCMKAFHHVHLIVREKLFHVHVLSALRVRPHESSSSGSYLQRISSLEKAQ